QVQEPSPRTHAAPQPASRLRSLDLDRRRTSGAVSPDGYTFGELKARNGGGAGGYGVAERRHELSPPRIERCRTAVARASTHPNRPDARRVASFETRARGAAS